MWEEIVDADGNDGITITTKRIPPPPLASSRLPSAVSLKKNEL
jgi:hypothetical protein